MVTGKELTPNRANGAESRVKTDLVFNNNNKGQHLNHRMLWILALAVQQSHPPVH